MKKYNSFFGSLIVHETAFSSRCAYLRRLTINCMNDTDQVMLNSAKNFVMLDVGDYMTNTDFEVSLFREEGDR